MKQQNFIFVDIVSSIFLLILLVGNFMGLLYISDGNLIISLLGSLFLVVCYFFVVQLLKRNKEEMIKKNFIHNSLLFWVFFLALGYVSFYLMSHFINIEYQVKSQIQKEATIKIKSVDSLSSKYKKRAKEDIQNFEAELKIKLEKYKATGNLELNKQLLKEPYFISENVLLTRSFIDVNQVAGAKVSPYELKIAKNIKNIDSTITYNNIRYQSVFDNWKRLSLVATYSKLNQYVEESVVLVNSKIAELPIDRTEIKVEIDKTQLPLNSPEKLNKRFPPEFLLPLIIVLVIHLFILIPFLSHKVRGYKNNSNSQKAKNRTKDKSGKSNSGTIEL